MKYTMLIAALWVCAHGAAQAVYTWNTQAGGWTTAASWTPQRTNPLPDDILQFGSNAVVSGLPVSESLGRLRIFNNAAVSFSAPFASGLIIGQPQLTLPQLSIEAGASLVLNGPGDILMNLPDGCSARISGSLGFAGAAHRLQGTNVNSLVFDSGSVFTAANGFTGNAFGITNINSVLFHSGARYISQDGGNPFGATAPGSVVQFESGSFYLQEQAVGLSLSGRVYGHLQTDANLNLTQFGSANDLTIQNNLVVNSGYFIFHPNTLHSGHFKIYGDILLNGNALLDLGNTNMSGELQLLGSNQLIGAGNGNGTVIIQNLRMNASGAASLERPVLINGNLNLQLGLINSSTLHMLTLAAGAKVISPVNAYGNTNEGWEQSYVNGPLQIMIASTEEKILPIGNNGVFAPARIQKGNANPITYRAAYFPMAYVDVATIANPPIDHVSKQEYWDFTATGSTADDDAKISLSWRPQSAVSRIAVERNDLMIAHYTDMGFGLKWNAEGNSPLIAGTANYGYITSDNYIASFSPFTLASRSIFNSLPLKLIDWKGRQDDEIIRLSCKSSPEIKSPGFTIEKSGDGKQFTTLDHVTAFQDPIHNDYSSLDNLPNAGKNYYRLRAEMPGGDYAISETISVNFVPKTGFNIYPNPAENQIWLKFSPPGSNGWVDIVNSSGQLLRTVRITKSVEKINIYTLNKGMYYIRFHNLKKVVTKTLFKH